MNKASSEKNKNKKRILFFIGCIVVGFVGGVFLGKTISLKSIGFRPIDFFIILISLYAWMFISINIHEFGHFIFGKKAKYKLIGYSIACFNWFYENGKVKFYLKFNKEIGGLCCMMPTKESSRKDHLLFISGGVIFNFISILLMFVGVFLVPSGKVLLKGILIAGIVVTSLLAIMNFIPIKSIGIATDGNIFWSILRNEPSGQIYLKILSVTNKLRGGVSFKDLDLNIDTENSEKIDAAKLQILLYGYFKALDLDNIEEVRSNIEFLENHIDIIPEYSRPGFYNEFIYYYSAIELKEEKAKEYFTKTKKLLINDKDINGRRTLASYKLFIENDYEEAKRCCFDGLSVKDKFPFKGQALLEEKLIMRILNKVNGSNDNE